VSYEDARLIIILFLTVFAVYMLILWERDQ